MTDQEHRIFVSTYGTAFAKYAQPIAEHDKADDKADDDAAVIAADVARRAVEAWRRLLRGL